MVVASVAAMVMAGTVAGAHDADGGGHDSFAHQAGGLGTFKARDFRSAVVGRSGVLRRGAGAVDATLLGTGQYEVRFNRNVRGCAWVATIGRPGAAGSQDPGEITVAGRTFGIVRGLFITTHNSSGAAANRAFHVIVLCP
jgi:hypothetical protein